MSDGTPERLRVERVDAEGLARMLEHLAPTPLWERLCAAYGVASDGGAIPPEALPRTELVGILKALFSELPQHVEFVGEAELAHVARGDNPALVMAALCDAMGLGGEDLVEDITDELELDEDDGDEVPDDTDDGADDEGGEARGGRPVFRFRSVYLAERGTDHFTFRLMGSVNGEDRKLMVTIRKDRPVRSQIAHAEGLHSLQIVPAGRLQQAVDMEMSRKRRGK
ncbi:MAG: hypothetical protein R3F39_19355 [Myxococcota bacterium]